MTAIEPIVVTAEIVPPSGFGDKARVIATMSDGELETVGVPLIEYFDDELSFTADEFIGMTEAEAIALFHKKDVAYLQA